MSLAYSIVALFLQDIAVSLFEDSWLSVLVSFANSCSIFNFVICCHLADPMLYETVIREDECKFRGPVS